MHLTCLFGSPLAQFSRWLMIVSTAMAVFPVWRSPMMSSRWPRPIGVIASMATIPVWSGSFTGGDDPPDLLAVHGGLEARHVLAEGRGGLSGRDRQLGIAVG